MSSLIPPLAPSKRLRNSAGIDTCYGKSPRVWVAWNDEAEAATAKLWAVYVAEAEKYGKPEHHTLKQMMVMIAVNGRPRAEAVIKFRQEPGGMLNHNPDKSRTGNFDLLPRKYPGLAWREL
ncbi:hypothetical protein B0H10DRAFT_1957982 [Mycena sp. CBHHK59/15]|nr:hypothetical protein B0H10DRAFT_1957982 [Mycena sp. CBHHK59/15]